MALSQWRKKKSHQSLITFSFVLHSTIPQSSSAIWNFCVTLSDYNYITPNIMSLIHVFQYMPTTLTILRYNPPQFLHNSQERILITPPLAPIQTPKLFAPLWQPPWYPNHLMLCFTLTFSIKFSVSNFHILYFNKPKKNLFIPYQTSPKGTISHYTISHLWLLSFNPLTFPYFISF